MGLPLIDPPVRVDRLLRRASFCGVMSACLLVEYGQFPATLRASVGCFDQPTDGPLEPRDTEDGDARNLHLGMMAAYRERTNA